MKKNKIIVLGLAGQAAGFLDLKTLPSYEFVDVKNDEEVIEMFQQRPCDMVIVDNVSKNENLRKLQAVLPIFNSEVVVLPYNGESSEEMEIKIRDIYRQKKLKRIQRLLILDASEKKQCTHVPPFSAN